MRNQITACFIFISVFIFNTAQAENAWVLSKEAEGIQVFVRDTPGSKIKSFKGVVSVPGRLTALIALLEDTKVYPRFLFNCKSGSSLKEVSDFESYKYIVTNMPWPVKDRDAIVHSLMKQNKKTKQVEIKLMAVPKYKALKPGRVRISKMAGRWVFTPEKNGVRVVYEMSVDPGGNLPKWIVNAMVVDMPFYTLKNLRSLVKQPVYQNTKRSYILE